ncbi:MAG TPA: hypothetical protein VHS28_03745 [Chloroflexota bacterium]|nr:hypothetical protein [Chloroflexota bacterium]
MTPTLCPSCQQQMRLLPETEWEHFGVPEGILAMFVCPSGHHVTVTSQREVGL